MAQLDPSDFVLIGVNADSDISTARQSAEKHKLRWQHFFDGENGEISRTWNIRSWPSTIVIDRVGKIRVKNLDYKPYKEIVKILEEIIAESAK